MANPETEKNITGLDQAANRKEAEYDLVKSLLEAAEFKTADENITEVEIKRGGKFYFAVRVHPISDEDIRFARKKATVFMPNPENKKLPPVEKDFISTKFKSWVVYLATTEEDQEKIWGNASVLKKFELQERWESVGTLLTAGEKTKLFNLVLKISGLNDEEYGDEETFQQGAD